MRYKCVLDIIVVYGRTYKDVHSVQEPFLSGRTDTFAV
jgi:hypothetical protein